jgi:hypothetical protein
MNKRYFLIGAVLLYLAIFSVVLLLSNCGASGGAMLTQQIAGPQGTQGDQGEQGIPGADGRDGSSCTTFNVPGGAVIKCTDGTSSIVNDGQPGSSIEIMNPCGDLDRQDEVFLKFTDSENTLTVVAFYAENGNSLFSRLSVLKCDGQTEYETTDGQRCEFKLDTDCNLIDEALK